MAKCRPTQPTILWSAQRVPVVSLLEDPLNLSDLGAVHRAWGDHFDPDPDPDPGQEGPFETVRDLLSPIHGPWIRLDPDPEFGHRGPPVHDDRVLAAQIRVLEEDRLATVSRGWSIGYTDPVDIFDYRSAQELATRVSHRSAGVQADDPVAYEVMNRVAVDENHHFMFYRGVTTAMLRQAPTFVLGALHRVLSDFNMPGTVIPNLSLIHI